MRLPLLVIILLLGGCSTLGTDSTQPDPVPLGQRMQLWQQHQIELSAIQDWELSGKLGIRTTERSSSVYLNWKQRGSGYRIRISSVIGQTLALLQGSSQGVALSTADHETLYASSPEQLLRQKLGWEFPVSSLQYWIKGIPAPGNSEPQLNDQGLLDQLEQGEWSIRFTRYQKVGDLQLPGRMVVEGPHARLTFIINNWNPKG